MDDDASSNTLGLTIAVAAAHLGVSRRTVERWIATGSLAVFRRGRVVRIPEDALVRLRAAGTTEAAASARSRPGRGRPVKLGARLWD